MMSQSNGSIEIHNRQNILNTDEGSNTQIKSKEILTTAVSI